MIAPSRFEGYRDQGLSALKTVGFSQGGHRCYYAFRYALPVMQWGIAAHPGTDVADSRQREAWLMLDGNWLVRDTLQLGGYTVETGFCIADECPC